MRKDKECKQQTGNDVLLSTPIKVVNLFGRELVCWELGVHVVSW